MAIFRIKHQLEGSSYNRLKYVVDFLNQHPLKPMDFGLELVENSNEKFELAYGISEGDWKMPEQRIFFQSKTYNQLYPNTYQYQDTSIFSVESFSREKKELVQEKVFQFDLFEAIFFHISRYEEVFAKKEDKGNSGWLKESLHFLIQHQIHEIPVVDHLVKVFFEIITGKTINKATLFSISHDLDLLGRFTPWPKFLKSLSASLIIRRNANELKNSSRYFVNMLLGRAVDPYDYFSTLLLEKDNWQSKTLFLMAGGETTYDNHYQLADSRIDEIIQVAEERGYQIGIHPSYNAGFKEELYRKEIDHLAAKLQKPIQDNRQHWLRMDWNATPYIWQKYGVKIDSSLGYSHYLGFRAGTGYAYRLYDFKAEKAFTFLERPFAFMDSAAIHYARNQQKPLQQVLNNFLKHLPSHSAILFNFHNSSFDPLTSEGLTLRQFYEKQIIALNG